MRIVKTHGGIKRSITTLANNQFEVIIGDRREIIDNAFEARYIFDNGFDKEDNSIKENNNGSKKESSKKDKRSRKERSSGVPSSRARATEGVQEFTGESSEDS